MWSTDRQVQSNMLIFFEGSITIWEFVNMHMYIHNALKGTNNIFTRKLESSSWLLIFLIMFKILSLLKGNLLHFYRAVFSHVMGKFGATLQELKGKHGTTE